MTFFLSTTHTCSRAARKAQTQAPLRALSPLLPRVRESETVTQLSNLVEAQAKAPTAGASQDVKTRNLNPKFSYHPTSVHDPSTRANGVERREKNVAEGKQLTAIPLPIFSHAPNRQQASSWSKSSTKKDRDVFTSSAPPEPSSMPSIHSSLHPSSFNPPSFPQIPMQTMKEEKEKNLIFDAARAQCACVLRLSTCPCLSAKPRRASSNHPPLPPGRFESRTSKRQTGGANTRRKKKKTRPSFLPGERDQ